MLLSQRWTIADLCLGLDLESVLLSRNQIADGSLVLVGGKVLGIFWDEWFIGNGFWPPLNGVTSDLAIGQQIWQIPLECYQVGFDINGFKGGQ